MGQILSKPSVQCLAASTNNYFALPQFSIRSQEARRMARDNVKMAVNANRRFSGFTCYAALAEHKASNIEEVSYQILLGKDKYFVSTDGGGRGSR